MIDGRLAQRLAFAKENEIVLQPGKHAIAIVLAGRGGEVVDDRLVAGEPGFGAFLFPGEAFDDAPVDIVIARDKQEASPLVG